MKTGRLSWRVREALERGLQSGAGSAAARQRERKEEGAGGAESGVAADGVVITHLAVFTIACFSAVH